MKYSVWKEAETNEEDAVCLSSLLGIPVKISALLLRRGCYDKASAEKFLNPRLSRLSDPFILPDIIKAVERTWKAIYEKEKIVVYGDYDVDGITATAIMFQTLKQLGADVDYFLPNRMDDGYGLSDEGLSKCMLKKPKLIITVDCGTNSEKQIQIAMSEGVDVIVTDHHEPIDVAGSAVAVVNPLTGDYDDVKYLAGVGVSFKFCHALLKYANNNDKPISNDLDLRKMLDMVALGTVADVVPLVGENRILAKYGMGQMMKTEDIGLKALMSVAGISDKVIDSYSLGYILGPRLNASGRLGTAETSLELLLTLDEDKALALAKTLDETNTQRKKIEDSIKKEALEIIEKDESALSHSGIVLASSSWHIGTIGIVASRLCSQYNRPVAVVSFEGNDGKGSCRSIEDLDVAGVLSDCSEYLENHGGHRLAAGFTIKKHNYDRFREKFIKLCDKTLNGIVSGKWMKFDDWLENVDVSNDFIDHIVKLEPFGNGNPEPIWGMRRLKLAGAVRVLKDKHLKMDLISGGKQFEAIAFNMQEKDLPSQEMDVLFTMQRNSFRGANKIQLNIKDIRSACQ